MPALRNKAFITGLFIAAFFSVSPLKAAPQPAGSTRVFRELFPSLTVEQIMAVFSGGGLRNNFTRSEAPIITPASNSGIDLLRVVRENAPTQLVEALIVIPYTHRRLTRLDAYNAVGRIQNISDYRVYSSSHGGLTPLFPESTRLYNGNRNRPIPDPPPARTLPSSETVYIRLRDAFFGNTYFRGEFSAGRHGITYNMTNNAAIRFLVFPVMRAEQFTAILYVEPLAEGMLIYGVAGVTIPEFLLNRLNLAAQIDRRVTLFMMWLRDGLRAMH